MMEIPLCNVCGQTIKHPICEKCHLRDVMYWMRDRNFSRGQQIAFLSRMQKVIKKDVPMKGYCISCYNELPSMCSYCFFYRVAKIMQACKVNNEDLESFLETFNYRHYEEDYVLWEVSCLSVCGIMPWRGGRNSLSIHASSSF